MSEEGFEFEMDEETAAGFNAFMDAIRENYELAVAHAEIMTQGVLYLMRTHGLDEVIIDEVDAGLIASDLESQNLSLNMEVDVKPEDEAAPWAIIFKIQENEATHPSVG